MKCAHLKRKRYGGTHASAREQQKPPKRVQKEISGVPGREEVEGEKLGVLQEATKAS